MSVSNIKGDLIELFKQGQFDIIVHGCNCFNVMGAGFSKQVKDNFYQAYSADSVFPLSKGIHRLGNVSGAFNCNGKGGIIYNAYTQVETGRAFNLLAFEMAMIKIANMVEINFTIAVPGLIGCGIGGGNKEKVMKILERVFKHHNLTVVYPQ